MPFLSEVKSGGAEAGGFPAVDAGEKRVREAVDHLGAVVTFDEGSDGLVVIGGPRGMEQLLRHTELPPPHRDRRAAGDGTALASYAAWSSKKKAARGRSGESLWGP